MPLFCWQSFISIHAPAKGATKDSTVLAHIIRISIHAPAKGATQPAIHAERQSDHFNPRSREGSDKHCGQTLTSCCDFNPRSREGSDARRRGARGNTGNFNPRSREGSDAAVGVGYRHNRNFNPRSREGSDSAAHSALIVHINFNPRSREGSDVACSFRFSDLSISIHAPAKGATESECTVAGNADISIHAPAKGATFSWVFIGFTAAQFQSTLPRRERQFFQYFHVLLFQFQSTLPRRERPYHERTFDMTITISIHAPAKGATISSAFFHSH